MYPFLGEHCCNVAPNLFADQTCVSRVVYMHVGVYARKYVYVFVYVYVYVYVCMCIYVYMFVL